MHVIVIGAGVIGVTTAWALARAGYSVELLEAGPGAALETSFANGGQLSFSHAEPWANPSVFRHLAGWLLNSASPVRFPFTTDPTLWKWGLRFLSASLPRNSRTNTKQLLKLALRSREAFSTLCKEPGLSFDHSAKGTLHIYRNNRNLARAARQAQILEKLGCQATQLSAADVLRKEPALAESNLVGAIYFPLDESGNARIFTQQLASRLATLPNTVCHYHTPVTRIISEGDRIFSIETPQKTFHADAYVLCCGVQSTTLAAPLGLSLPIVPMKGYSLSIALDETTRSSLTPQHAITDNGSKVVYSRLGNTLRAAGMAEIGIWNRDICSKRVSLLQNAVSRTFPHYTKQDKIETWCGLRPATPDGLPCIGPTRYHNLFLNTGHGTLGWTLAAGSALLLSEQVQKYLPLLPHQSFMAAA